MQEHIAYFYRVSQKGASTVMNTVLSRQAEQRPRPVLSPLRGALYRQVAGILRDRITSGQYPTGLDLPAAKVLAVEFDVSTALIHKAYQVLGAEGLITRSARGRWRIRAQAPRHEITLTSGRIVRARMPTPEEQQQFVMDPGVPMLIVGDEVYPADRYAVIGGGR